VDTGDRSCLHAAIRARARAAVGSQRLREGRPVERRGCGLARAVARRARRAAAAGLCGAAPSAPARILPGCGLGLPALSTHAAVGTAVRVSCMWGHAEVGISYRACTGSGWMHLAGGDPGGMRASADAERSAGFSALEPAAAGGEREDKPGQAGAPGAEPAARAPAAPATKPPRTLLVTLALTCFECKIITISLHDCCLCNAVHPMYKPVSNLIAWACRHPHAHPQRCLSHRIR